MSCAIKSWIVGLAATGLLCLSATSVVADGLENQETIDVAQGGGTSTSQPERDFDDVSLDQLLIEEITVTARKREEMKQETPISMTALGAQDLQDQMITEVRQIGEIAPNLLFDWAGPTPNRARVYVRGIGQDDPITTLEPGVGMYIDGVYMGRAIAANWDMFDLERVEILRGPQGTLYGKNTVGGAINLISAKPDGELAGEARVTSGSDGMFNTRLSLKFPIFEESLYAGLALSSSSRDGYVNNAFDDSKLDIARKLGGRFTLRWLPSDSWDVTFAYDRGYAREHPIGGDLQAVLQGCGVSLLCPVSATVAGFVKQGQGNANVDLGSSTAGAASTGASGRDDNDVDFWGTLLVADWDMSEMFSLKSTTAYRELDTANTIDVDASPLSLLEVFDHDEQWQLSQEFQLNGSLLEDRLDLVAGLYYLTEHTENEGETLIIATQMVATPAPATFSSNNDKFDTDTISYAGYLNADYAFTDRLTGTAGLRWTYEDKEFTRSQWNLFSGARTNFSSPSLNDKAFSPKLGLRFQWTDDLMAYASWSRGFRSGGFNGRSADNNPNQLSPFKSETIKALEVGVKSRWFEDRLEFNVAAFRSYYSDYQVTRFTSDLAAAANFVSVVDNVDQARVLGFEVEARALPMRGLDLTVGVGVLNAKFQHYKERNLITNVISDQDQRDFKNSPELTANLSAAYTFGLFDSGSVTVRADYNHRSKVYYNVSNSEVIRQNKRGLWNGRIAWENPEGTLEFALWGRNLADREWKSFGLDFTGSFGYQVSYWAPPRQVGVELTVRY